MRAFLLAAGLLLATILPTPARAGGPVAPEIGAFAPAALGQDGRNRDVTLADYRGKVVIVTFWASWCGYCLKELPALNALQQQAGEQWLKIIAVNVQDANQDYRAMTRQMRDYTLLLARDRDGSVAERYAVRSYPNLWMIDPQGRVASHHVGYGEESLAAIVAEIKRVLTVEMERRQGVGAGTAGAAP